MSGYKVLGMASLLLTSALTLSGAVRLSFNRASALAGLAAELGRRYGYLVTYEEAPFDATQLREKKLANGRRYIYPLWKPVEFQLPEELPAHTEATRLGQPMGGPIPPLTPAILDPLVERYNHSGNPGNFSVIYQGRYAHIVQLTRLVNGRTEKFVPILSTEVALRSEEQPCNVALNDLLGQLGTLRGAGFVQVNTGMTNSWSRECHISGGTVPARDALEEIFNQVTAGPAPGLRPVHYAWSLMYDRNWGVYFLDVWLVPDMTWQPPKPAPPPGRAVPATPPPPGAPSRLVAPRPVKKD